MEINVAKMINPHFDVLMKPQQYFTYSNAVFEGGRASTKSSAISLALVLWFLADKNANVVTFRKVANTLSGALMSRLWTGFFGTARCRYPEKFSKPGFQPKMA